MAKDQFPRPRKALGQHFLTDPRILARIADALGSTAGDTVVEIGPGRGALTDALLARAARVVAIEFDRELAKRLRLSHPDASRLTIIDQDVLEVPLGEAAGGPFLLAGNVPYNITTPILFHALQRPRATRAVYLVQKEVAERVVAPPASEAYGALSVNVQALAKAEILFAVAAGAFNPPPKVESAVLRITPLAEPLITEDEEKPFKEMVISAFSFRRKQMGRVVREVWEMSAEQSASLLASARIEPELRPEVLAPMDFVRLLRAKRATSDEQRNDGAR
jgi:16S rRNA (adenine1518-N6/adenine1519-N6)-dimethyltransferase